ncbi:hypothetical protein RhiJN_05955 [Ceratobasidium sp. AG-Ba]|nr:hypothetical protein RhiJN_05955 [Ceratobasidium sp. AG-Ba]QRW06878.1 hypothetical protein RhiLY_05877 [Ceratobasidium sp. AG-Ba]
MATSRLFITALFAFSSISMATPIENLRTLFVPAPTGRAIEPRSSSATGWHKRSEPHPDGSSYVVKQENLVLGLGRSTRREPEGFTVAFFKPDVAIDAMGKVLKVKADDFSALVDKAYETVGLPQSDLFGNLWSVKQPVSDLAIDRLLTAGSSSSIDQQHIISVYGHDGVTRELEEPVGGYTELPESLNDILTLGKEAREDYIFGEEDTAVVDAANAVLRKP